MRGRPTRQDAEVAVVDQRKESVVCMESKCIVSPSFTVPLIDRIENMSCMQRRAAAALSLMSVCVHGTELLATCGAGLGDPGPSLPDCDAPRAHVTRIDACQPTIHPYSAHVFRPAGQAPPIQGKYRTDPA
jgi:hypothetical protein